MNILLDSLAQISVQAVGNRAYGLGLSAAKRLKGLLFFYFLGQAFSYIFATSVISLCAISIFYSEGYITDIGLVSLANFSLSTLAILSFVGLLIIIRQNRIEKFMGLEKLRGYLDQDSMDKGAVQILQEVYKVYEQNEQAERFKKIEKSLAAVMEALKGLDSFESQDYPVTNEAPINARQAFNSN